jgi:hypothetical protein
MMLARMMGLIACAFAIAVASPAVSQTDPAITRAIEAVAYDYVDGQLEGNVERVTRALHPDLAKRTPRRETPYETLALGRMTSDELISLTREGALKTPRDKWDRSVSVLAVDQGIATVRVETPWFIDHLQLARFEDRWVIVNALWRGKPRPAQP